MDRTVDALKVLDVQQLFPDYCTDLDSVERLYHEFPQRTLPLASASTGTRRQNMSSTCWIGGLSNRSG